MPRPRSARAEEEKRNPVLAAAFSAGRNGSTAAWSPIRSTPAGKHRRSIDARAQAIMLRCGAERLFKGEIVER